MSCGARFLALYYILFIHAWKLNCQTCCCVWLAPIYKTSLIALMMTSLPLYAVLWGITGKVPILNAVIVEGTQCFWSHPSMRLYQWSEILTFICVKRIVLWFICSIKFHFYGPPTFKRNRSCITFKLNLCLLHFWFAVIWKSPVVRCSIIILGAESFQLKWYWILELKWKHI